MRGLFVTGTDTGVGKSVVAAAICAALVARGVRVSAFKPVVTGLDEPPGEWPRDHELLAGVTGQQPSEVAPLTFGPPVSPHLAAELDATAIDPRGLLAAARRASAGAEVLVCEGVGGLLVPLSEGYSVRDLAADLALPLVIVARPGLGTINHTLLTVEAARSAGLPIAGIVMTPWSAQPGRMEASNKETLERLSRSPVHTLPHASPSSLSAVGATLPTDEWV